MRLPGRVDTVASMPRYLVERTFRDPLLAAGAEGRRTVQAIVGCNSDRRVMWLHTYVSPDGRTWFCVYDAPSPEAIRLVARSNGLPVDRIIEVSMLDPSALHLAEDFPK